MALDPDYWPSRCEGFLVDAPDGEVGIVDEVVKDASGDSVDFLAVAGGWLGRKRFVLTTAEVEEIRPRQQRLRVRSAPSRRERSSFAPRFPFSLLERSTSRRERREADTKSKLRSVHVGPGDEVVELLGKGRGN